MPDTQQTNTSTVQVIELKDVPNAVDLGNGKVYNPDFAPGGRYYHCR